MKNEKRGGRGGENRVRLIHCTSCPCYHLFPFSFLSFTLSSMSLILFLWSVYLVSFTPIFFFYIFKLHSTLSTAWFITPPPSPSSSLSSAAQQHSRSVHCPSKQTTPTSSYHLMVSNFLLRCSKYFFLSPGTSGYLGPYLPVLDNVVI